MDNQEYLFAAYTIIWAGLFGYIWWLSARAKTLQRSIDELAHRLEGRRNASE